MTFGAPWALWALIALPLLAVLLLVAMRPQQMVAGTLSIWMRLADQIRIEPPSWRHRLRDLLPPMVAAVLLVFAASRPQLEAGASRRLVILFDTSISLAAPAGEAKGSRHEALMVKARALVRRAGADGEVLLIVPPSVPRTLGGAMALQSLEGRLELVGGLVDVAGGISVLLEEAARGSECWLLGDVPDGQLDTLRDLGIGIFTPAAPHENAGVTFLGVEQREDRTHVAASIWSTGLIPQIDLIADGAPVETHPVQRVSEDGHLEIEILEELGPELPAELELRLFHRADRFAWDDLATFNRGASYAVEGAPLPPEVRATLQARGWREGPGAPEVLVVGAADPSAVPDPPPGAPPLLVVATPAPADVSVDSVEVRDRIELDTLAGLVWEPGSWEALQATLPAIEVTAEVRRASGRGEDVLARAGAVPLVTRLGTRIDFLLVLESSHELERHQSGVLPILLDGLAELLAPGSRGGCSGVLDHRVSRRVGRRGELLVEPDPRGAAGGVRLLDLSLLPLALALALAAGLRRAGGSARGSP